VCLVSISAGQRYHNQSAMVRSIPCVELTILLFGKLTGLDVAVSGLGVIVAIKKAAAPFGIDASSTSSSFLAIAMMESLGLGTFLWAV